MKRAAIVAALAGLGMVGGSAVALAAEPPVATCGFLSAVVCQVPVSVGPFTVPVDADFLFPNGIFGPPPSAG